MSSHRFFSCSEKVLALRRNDPLGPLVESLIIRRPPPLAWVVRWQSDGKDPVHAAWAASEDAELMWDLIELTATQEPDRQHDAIHAVAVSGPICCACGTWWVSSADRREDLARNATVMRSIESQLGVPTLNDVLSRVNP